MVAKYSAASAVLQTPGDSPTFVKRKKGSYLNSTMGKKTSKGTVALDSSTSGARSFIASAHLDPALTSLFAASVSQQDEEH